MTAIQTLAAQLNRCRTEEDTLKVSRRVTNGRRLDAAVAGRVAMEEAIAVLRPTDDIDALIAAGLLGKRILDSLDAAELEVSPDRRLALGLIAYLERKTGRSLSDVCPGLNLERLISWTSEETRFGGRDVAH